MKLVLTISAAILVLTFASSCRTVDHFDKRKYTDGKYHDLNLFKDRSEKGETNESVVIAEDDSCKVKSELLLEEVKCMIASDRTEGNIPATKALHAYYPRLADRMDSTIAGQMNRDSTSWMNDTLPEAIATALSTQAMLGLGTVGGLVTIAAPQSIWFFAIPMFAAPIMLLISLIAAAVAMSKINRGEIDTKFKGAMKLWAACMLINLILGSLVVMHYAF